MNQERAGRPTDSLRLQIRRGTLARTERRDRADDAERREPDELLVAEGEFEADLELTTDGTRGTDGTHGTNGI